jgi:hypothetical protein
MKSQLQEGTTKQAQLSEVNISLVTPTGGYHVEGTINGKETSFLVDTGAAVTLMRKDMWDEINSTEGEDLKPWADRRLVSVDGTPLQVYGCSSVNLTLGGRLCLADVVVVSPLTTTAILGLDFLRKYKVTVDMGSSMFNLGSHSLKLQEVPQPELNNGSVPGAGYGDLTTTPIL